MQKNWTSILPKVEQIINMYSQRHLSFLAKSNVIQTLVCSKLWYVGTVLQIPKHICKKITRLLFKFFWGKKVECVNRNTMQLPLNEGGFKIVNILNKIRAFHVKHICNMFQTEAKWYYFAVYWLGMSLRNFNPDFASNLIPHSENIPQFYLQALVQFKAIIQTDTNFSDITTKKLYVMLMERNTVIPRIIGKYPRVDFIHVWKNIQNKFVDPTYRDVSWRIAHHVLPVGGYLYEKNISTITVCYFCKGFESLIHLMVFCNQVLPFWRFIESVITQYVKTPVKINAYMILFHIFPNKLDKEIENVMNYILCLGKHCIWSLRNKCKYENETVSVTRIILLFIAHLKLRISADFKRFDRNIFIKIWCRNSVFAQMVTDNKFQIVLKPP